MTIYTAGTPMVSASNTPPSSYPDVVAVVSMKGGTGRTTLCTNLSYSLAYFLDLRVLLIDMDPQASATVYLLSDHVYHSTYLAHGATRLSVVELYREYEKAGRDESSAVQAPERFLQRIYAGGKGYLDLLASKLDLAMHEPDPSGAEQIRWFLRTVGAGYDVVIIDCPPGTSQPVMAALAAAQHLLLPVMPDLQSSFALALLDRFIKQKYPQIPASRPPWLKPPAVLGVVLTMVKTYNDKATASQQQAIDEIKKMGYPMFQNYLSASVKYVWGSGHPLPIFRTEPRSRYAQVLNDLACEFYDRLHASGEGQLPSKRASAGS